jgi:hypothetical protein
MAAEYVRSSLTDEYNVMFSQVSDCTAEQAEKVIMNALITASNFDVSSNTYQSTSGGRNITWGREKLADNLIDSCAISNYPNGTVTSKSVLSIESDPVYHPLQEKITSMSAKSGYVPDGDKNTSSLKLLDCSPFYDATYVIDQSIVQECFNTFAATSVTTSATEDAHAKASFDLSNTNILIQHAMQSKWNTHAGPYENLGTCGDNPTAMSQDASFNTTKAFGMSGTSLAGEANYSSQWAQSSRADGKVTFVTVSDAFQPCKNNLRVSDRTNYDASLNLDNDVGMYKIVQSAPIIDVAFLCYDFVDSSTNVASELVVNNNAPIFDRNKPVSFGASSSKSVCEVPQSLNESQLFAMLGSAAGDNVSDNWKFNVEIATTANSGYNLSGAHPLIETLDNSNLKDSIFYMENYVSDNHEIAFSNGSVTVTASDNGVPATATLMTVDLNNGEKLPSEHESVNGRCIIDSNTATTRTGDISNNGMSNITASVFYTGESTTGLGPISDAEKNSAYFAISAQKVVQDTSTDTVKFLSNNDAIVNLYTEADGIVNHAFDASNYNFVYTNNTSDNVVWRLNSTNELLNKQPSLSLDENYTQTLKDSNPTMNIYGTFKGLDSDNITYHEFRNKLTAKKLTDLGLNAVVNGTMGWSLAYSDPSDNFLKTDGNTAAYTQKVAHLPNLENSQDPLLSYLNTAGASLNYKYEYLPYYCETGTTKRIYTCDSLLLTYSPVNNASNVTEYNIQIPTTNTTKDVQISETFVTVSPTDYKDLLISRTAQTFVKANAVLKLRTVTNSIDVKFPALYGPFSNIDMCIKDIIQVSTDYVVFYNGVLTYDIILKKSTVPAEMAILSKYELTESYTLNGSPTLILEGSLVVNDLKPFTGVFQGKDLSNNFVTITTGTTDVDTYYSLDTKYDLDFGSPMLPTVTTVMWYEYDQSDLILDREFYYVPFILSEDAVYSIESFTFNVDTIIDTLAGSSKFLTSADGYAAANTKWVTSEYNVTVVTESNNTTLTVKKTNGDEVFHITFTDIITNFGGYLISHFQSDIWRFIRTLGVSAINSTSVETFALTDYSVDSENRNVLPVSGSPGVYLYSNKNGSSAFDSSTISTGSRMSFRVLGDYVSANLVGIAGTPSSSNELTNSLSFQYTNPINANEYSAAINLPWYRGYVSPTPLVRTLQHYTINRQKLNVDFNVKRAGATLLTQRLTTHLNEVFVVDALFDSGTSNSFNLNLKSKLLYSIPPTSIYSLPIPYTFSYPIDIIGDRVTVTMDVANSYTTPPPFVNKSTTLKDNNLYTFSGIGPVTIRPSRVKLYNSDFMFNKFSYLIHYSSSDFVVKKAFAVSTGLTTNHLGDPYYHNEWIPFKTLSTYEEKVNGINIGSKNIGQISTKREMSEVVSYFISCAPYLKFETISTAGNPLIPYNYATTYTSNKIERYLAYTGETNTFNPFKPNFVIRDNSNNDLSITTNDANYINDIAFTYISNPSLNDMFKSANNSRFGIIVPGVLLTITMYASKAITSGVSVGLQLCKMPITAIQSSLPNIDENINIVFRNRENNGSINFSLIESLALASLGTQTNESYATVFKTPSTPAQSTWYNINFNIGNSSWNNLASNTFQITVDGVKAKLYTVVDVNKSQKNVRRIYKYEMITAIDLYEYKINRAQSLNLPFSGARVYYDYELPNNSYSSTAASIQDYDALLSSVTPALSGSINWSSEADSDYDSATSVYVSWAFGNRESSLNMPVKMFDILSSQRQWVFLKLAPFMQFKNQFGLTVSEISWDGSVVAPTIKTSNNNIPGYTPGLHINNNSTLQEYSISTADKDLTARLSVLENLVKTHIISHLL